MKDASDETIAALLELNVALSELLQEMLHLLIIVCDDKKLDAPTADAIHRLASGVIERAKRG